MLEDKFWKETDKAIPGWMSKEEAQFLLENVEGKFYVEIGVAYGKSLSLVRHHYPDMEVVGIDLINHGVEKKVNNVEIIYGNANELNSRFIDGSIDTLFVDGDHQYDGCLSDMVRWYNKVKKGGTIMIHDYNRKTREHEGVTQAVNVLMPMLKDFKYVDCIAAGQTH